MTLQITAVSSLTSVGSLGQPTITSVVPGDGQITITFTSLPGATSHNLYYDTTSGVTKTTGTKITSVTSPYVHGGLTNGTEYFYVATGVDSNGEYDESNELSATPSGSSDVDISAASLLVAVTESFAVSEVSYVATAVFTPDGTPAILSGAISLISSSTLALQANPVNTSEVSLIAAGAITGEGMAVSSITVGSLTNVREEDEQNIITFDEILTADSHNVYFKTANSGVTKTNGVKLTGVSSPFTHTGLVNGVTYYYVYTAVFAAGESDESNELSGTPMAIDRLDFFVSETGVKHPCKVATTANITLSALQDVDGVSLVQDDRVLVKNQTTGADNGIYLADTGTWNRAPDFDGISDISNGTAIRITNGTTLSRSSWEITTADPIIINTTSITFSRISAGISFATGAFTTGTIGASATENTAITHGLGTDNVVIGLRAEGENANKWEIGIGFPDGAELRFISPKITSITEMTLSSPSTGDVNILVKNRDDAGQTITVTWTAYANE